MTPAATAAGTRELPHPTRAEIRLEVLHALSDPVRLRIVRDLAADSGALFSCSHFDLPVTKSTTTYHFRVLRESG